jgi:hypothetical protein
MSVPEPPLRAPADVGVSQARQRTPHDQPGIGD